MARLGLARKKSDKPQQRHMANTPAPMVQEADLTERQRKFVSHYLATGNASQAAIKAGYSKKTAPFHASRLLKNVKVKAVLAPKAAAQIAEIDITAKKTLAEVAKLAFSNMADYMRVGPEGAPVVDFGGLTRDQAAALQSVTVEEFVDGRSDKREVRRVKFQLSDKAKSLEMLMKHFRLLVDHHEHNHRHEHTLMGLLLKEIDEESRARTIDHEAA